MKQSDRWSRNDLLQKARDKVRDKMKKDSRTDRLKTKKALITAIRKIRSTKLVGKKRNRPNSADG